MTWHIPSLADGSLRTYLQYLRFHTAGNGYALLGALPTTTVRMGLNQLHPYKLLVKKMFTYVVNLNPAWVSFMAKTWQKAQLKILNAPFRRKYKKYFKWHVTSLRLVVYMVKLYHVLRRMYLSI